MIKIVPQYDEPVRPRSVDCYRAAGERGPEAAGNGCREKPSGFLPAARMCASQKKWPQVRGHSDTYCLAENALVRKGFFVALQAQIVVPRGGKLLVLFLQFEKGDIVVTDDGA
jgi:hypothetical protein